MIPTAVRPPLPQLGILAIMAALLCAIAATITATAAVSAQEQAPAQPQPQAPAGIALRNGANPGAVIISWNPVAGAQGYRIGWANLRAVRQATADGIPWTERFTYADVRTSVARHTAPNLAGGEQYAFIVATRSSENRLNWSDWQFHATPNAPDCPPGGAEQPTEQPPAQPSPHSAAGDRAALVALYNATGGANWRNKSGWLSDAPLGRWHGVTTDPGGRVTRLDLRDNDLTGVTIPAELGNLSNLQRLSITGNWQLTGRIPASLGNLSNLEKLQLDSNRLTGTIPVALSRLSKLQELQLGNNLLAGRIPTELGNLSNLRELNLGGNLLIGAIPPELGRLSRLESLSLSHNYLTGVIPAELGNLSRLESLGLGGTS